MSLDIIMEIDLAEDRLESKGPPETAESPQVVENDQDGTSTAFRDDGSTGSTACISRRRYYGCTKTLTNFNAENQDMIGLI